MIDNLEKAIEEHLVPIKDGRNNPWNSNSKNKHNLN